MTRPPFSVLAFALPMAMLIVSPAESAQAKQAAEPIRYSRDILPILSDHCFHCHGPDAATREADLRLDEEAMLAHLATSGFSIVAPGDPEQSELHYRITTDDTSEVMPPPGHPKQLTQAQKALLQQWIEEGAAWEEHWSFLPVTPPAAPKAEAEDPIDGFLLDRLAASSLQPGPPADDLTWLRRVSLDLTGLPPGEDLVASFLSHHRRDLIVNELLASRHFGERMAWDWLEAARYADTHGYQKDNLRSMWLWRDWVVEAFNRNQPFDQFTIEQLAGDLLTSPTQSQLIATGFNRNHRINAEAGAIDEEYRVENVVDRVDTTATVWMGLTAGCARCHDHKFDPLTQREFFELSAFFNNIAEKGTGGVDPTVAPDLEVELPGFRESIAALDEELAKANESLRADAAAREAEFETWLRAEQGKIEAPDRAVIVEPARVLTSSGGSTFTPLPDHSILFGGSNPLNDTHTLEVTMKAPLRSVTHVTLEAIPHESLSEASLSRSFDGDFHLSEFVVVHEGSALPIRRASATAELPERTIRAAYDGDPLTGWSVGGGQTHPVSATFELASPLDLEADEVVEFRLEYQSREEQCFIGRFRVQLGSTGTSTVTLPQSRFEVITQNDRAALREDFPESSPLFAAARAHRDAIAESLESTRAQATTKVMVMKERPGKPRPTHILGRGLYDQPGEEVTPGVPAFLNLPLPTDAPANRLAFAQWLTDPAHPLTARVTVNRLWQQFFGTGLVKTAEDFGRQGERPSHPELLDYLSTEFIESGWDVKALIRRLVLTDAYARSSAVGSEQLENDPENRLLSRGPRSRLPAPVIRDQALWASGLLVDRPGGPPTRPWQPPGLWEAVAGVNSNTTRYVEDSGDGRFRRSLYTLWKRGVPPPSMILFDAASREICDVSPHSTNTPLQALVTLNDPTFAVSAATLGVRTASRGEGPAKGIQSMWQRLLTREPREEETALLLSRFQEHLHRYESLPESAMKRLAPVTRADVRIIAAQAPEAAAYTEIAEILFNLDATLTKH